MYRPGCIGCTCDNCLELIAQNKACFTVTFIFSPPFSRWRGGGESNRRTRSFGIDPQLYTTTKKNKCFFRHHQPHHKKLVVVYSQNWASSYGSGVIQLLLEEMVPTADDPKFWMPSHLSSKAIEYFRCDSSDKAILFVLRPRNCRMWPFEK